MVEEAESSSMALMKDDKPVIVRVKRKSYQSPLEAFWLEINERPVKRPLLDFEKLSISESASKVEESKPKKFFVQHVDTVSSSDVVVDILQSFVASKPSSADALDSKAKPGEQRRSSKSDNQIQKQLLEKAKETQMLLAKNARFEQIWKSRKEKRSVASDDALHDMCQLYDVVRVDAGETSVVQEEDDDEDGLMRSFLPLLQEFIPSAAEELEYEFDHRMIKQASKDEYVYDLYAVKDKNNSMMDENTSYPFPLVQVNDDDDFYDGPDNSDYETDDSNAEDNPLNDYPEEEEEEDGSEGSNENSEEDESESSIVGYVGLSDDDMLIQYDEDDEAYW